MNFEPNSTDQYQKAMIHNSIPLIDSYSILIHNGCYVHNPACQLPEGIMISSDETGYGFSLFIPANAKPSKPIQIINRLDGRNNTLIQPFNRVIVEAGSSAELLVTDCTLSEEPCTCDEIMDITLGEAAAFNMVRLQNMNGVSRLTTLTNVHHDASSRMKTHFVALGGGFIRNRFAVVLAGKKAEHSVFGLSMTRQTERVENDIFIIHAYPDCQSNQLFKQILSDSSTGAFTGCIFVDRDSQKTIAYQRSSSILLHPKAKMDIRPQLEIYADDVKCSHGATVGQLDAEALFYLRSRGISEAEATKILLLAFAREALDSISCTPFRESILKNVRT
jgi:Fe-S cluster assembly protein SufD